MDGEAVARMIKTVPNMNSDTPLIVLTTLSQDILDIHVLFDEVLQKPVTNDTICQIMKKYSAQ
jgi:CheY-like chemotaxis protein